MFSQANLGVGMYRGIGQMAKRFWPPDFLSCASAHTGKLSAGHVNIEIEKALTNHVASGWLRVIFGLGSTTASIAFARKFPKPKTSRTALPSISAFLLVSSTGFKDGAVVHNGISEFHKNKNIVFFSGAVVSGGKNTSHASE